MSILVTSISVPDAASFGKVLAGICAMYLICQVLYRLFWDPLRHIPGPLLARFTTLWELVAVLRGDFFKSIVDLHDQYGPVVRLGPNRVDFATEEAVKTIYSYTSGFPKSRFYEPFGDPNEPHMLNIKDNEKHAYMRKQIASLYSMTSLVQYESTVDSQNIVLLQKLSDIESKQRVFKVPSLMQQYAFDTIAAITTGEPIGMLPAESDVSGIIYAIHVSMVYAGIVGIIPWLHKPFVYLEKLLQKPPSFEPIIKYVSDVVHNSRIRPNEQGANDFVTRMLEKEKKGKASPQDTFTAVANNIVAGSDTTGITLSALLYHIYSNRQILISLRHEIDNLAFDGKLSNPVTWAEAQEMPYLQAVIKEGLRMHPAVGMQLTRSVPSGGATISGHYLPQGADVGVNAWALHRCSNIFGEDAKIFRPERWHDASSSLLVSSNSLFSFGAGSRTCIGKNISLLEVTKVLPQIVRNFDMEILAPPVLDGNWFVKLDYSARLRQRSL